MTTDLHEIIRNRTIAPDILRLDVARGSAEPVRPGQFHMVKTEAPEPLLPRPLSIYDAGDDTLSFLYEVKGLGTRNIAALVPGDRIRITGPIGNGFPMDELTGRVLMVAGGIGIAPFSFLARSLAQAGRDRLTLAAGFRSQPYGIEDFKPWVTDIRIATEDGSAGVKGRVPLLFEPGDFDVVVACGPVPMMRAVQQMCLESGTRAFLSMEVRMACGIGACLGCTIPTATGMRRVCMDGPVFPADEVILHDHP